MMGSPVFLTPWAAPLETTITIAKDGMVRHSADAAQIVDDESTEVVWLGTRDAQRP
jgi:hypothetical protein